MGAGAEIAAEITQRCFLNLHAPVKRIAGASAPSYVCYYQLTYVLFIQAGSELYFPNMFRKRVLTNHLVFSTPVALVYEKFYTPDAVRVVDGIMETLKY